jgi:hypothetical protein
MPQLPPRVGKAAHAVHTTFTTVARVYRKSSVSDGAGGSTDSYPLYATYPCSFARAGTNFFEREATNSVQTINTWTFVFAEGTRVLPTDRLVCNNRNFEVISGASSSWEIVTRVLAQEII